jgi:hypothetical protein
MNREDIIRMAREAGASTEIKHVTVGNGDGIVFTPDELARFANRVAAAEREACAKVCEENAVMIGVLCADAIRARGQ